MGDIEWMGPIVSDPQKTKREAIWRKNHFQEVSVLKPLLDQYLEQGWEEVRQLKTKVRLRKLWPHDQRLENMVWYLFHLLGYPVLNSGRSFKVRIERKGAEPLYKQIDVLAKDDETVLVVECKSSAEISRRSLQKDVEEFANLKGPIANAIRKQFGLGYKPKIIWLFATSNILWSKPDRDRAAGSNINIITERELRYYLQIADHLRSAARFQFLAEFLKDQKIPEMENVRVPAVRGKLGGRTFYSFVSNARQMLKIAFVNHRSLNDPEGAPTYQRLVSRTRLRQISKFLSDGGFFPTNILVNFPRKCRFEQIAKDDDTSVVFGHLYLPERYRSAWVIDGQHRLYGYAPLSDKHLSQNIMVVAFEELDSTEEANLFVTINHEQKSVPKTLLDDLEGALKWGSEKPSERIGAIIARLIGQLNADIAGPLYGRVTQQGIPGTEKTCLTVPALKDGLRRSGLVGYSVLDGKEYSPGPLSGLTDAETLDRAQSVLGKLLDQLAEANSRQWEAGKSGHLCINIALQAYFQFFGSLIAYMESVTGLSARELEPLALVSELDDYLAPVIGFLKGASDVEMAESFTVKYGSGGPREYYFRLCRLVQEEHPAFVPDGLVDWMESRSVERVAEADRKLKELYVLVQKTIFDRFKRLYGLEKDAYWNRGVVDKGIKAKAYTKSLDYEGDDLLALENYLDFIEYKKIVENKEHWPLFKPVFDIPEPGERGLSKNLKWMERVNELRRVSAHATENRSYKVDDFDYIDRVYEEFTTRLHESDEVTEDTVTW